MSEKREIKCDGCGKADINYTGNAVDYYLQLASVRSLPWYVKNGEQGGCVTGMSIDPPISSPKHFCSLQCLEKWDGGGDPHYDHARPSSTYGLIFDQTVGNGDFRPINPIQPSPFQEDFKKKFGEFPKSAFYAHEIAPQTVTTFCADGELATVDHKSGAVQIDFAACERAIADRSIDPRHVAFAQLILAVRDKTYTNLPDRTATVTPHTPS